MANGIFIPETDQEEAWEMRGRVNALHDIMKHKKGSGYFASDCIEVCLVMGFDDILDDVKRTTDLDE